MPRVSSSPDDAFHFKGGFADGWGAVVDSKAIVFQFPPRQDGSQDPPALYHSLTIQRYNDGEFQQKSAEQPSEVLLKICGPDSDGVLSTCTPGNYPDGDVNADPVDCGGDLGAEGNTLFAQQNGFAINDKTKYMRLCQSLKEKGYKDSILKRTYFPDFINLHAYFKTETVKFEGKGNKKFENDPTIFIVTDIRQFPYEKAATTAKAAPAAKGKVAAKANGTAKPAEVEEAAAAAGAEEIAEAIVTKTLKDLQNGKVLNDVKKLKVEVLMAAMKHKPSIPADLKKDVNSQLGDEDWLMATGIGNNVFVVTDENKIDFNV